MDCENCWYYDYDEDTDEYYCMQEIDEDLYFELLSHPKKRCPYWKDANEYTVAGKQ